VLAKDRASKLRHSVRQRIIQKVISVAVWTDSSQALSEDIRRAQTKKTAGSGHNQTCRAFSGNPQHGQSDVGCSPHLTILVPTLQNPEVPLGVASEPLHTYPIQYNTRNMLGSGHEKNAKRELFCHGHI
jgi:hypothetical protein